MGFTRQYYAQSGFSQNTISEFACKLGTSISGNTCANNPMEFVSWDKVERSFGLFVGCETFYWGEMTMAVLVLSEKVHGKEFFFNIT